MIFIFPGECQFRS